ncbi:MAG TPA: hypothetical protein VG708_15995, partial [Mycobacteriales bacterium]|nr:hypothetical protein [Mycobacteriales bacterium]
PQPATDEPGPSGLDALRGSEPPRPEAVAPPSDEPVDEPADQPQPSDEKPSEEKPSDEKPRRRRQWF